MKLERVGQLLKTAMGLETASIGLSAIERAVRTRVAASGSTSADSYWDLVSSTPTELQALIEEVVVPETWFFRDRQAFAALAQLGAEAWASRSGGRPLRLLSLPCSTGEEAYTLSMALLDAGLLPSAFQIDAVDISARALDHAQRGVYGRNSFRGADTDFRDRHFDATAGGYRISEEVRGPVRFAQGNLFDPGLGARAQAYDFVFCRNLLIYFDAAGQARAIEVLRRLLAPQGVLFLGHAEAGLTHGKGFTSTRIAQAFAFRTGLPAPLHERPAAPPRRPMQAASRRIPPRPVAVMPQPRAAAQRRPTPGLDEIRRTADAGRLDEAARLGRDYLRQVEPSPEALHLLGVINEAAGDCAAAAHHYRKALYLDPYHHEALDHLALLLERQGDRPGAKIIRDRARRAERRDAAK